MYLIEKAYAAGYLMLQEGNQKYGNAVRRAMAILTACLFVFNQVNENPVFATAAGTAKDKRLVDTIKMVLGMVYVIMVVVGVFLLVTNIMAYATADADNGPARTKATYGIAGGGLLIMLPAILTMFPFAEWVGDQVKDFIGRNSDQH